MGWLLYSTAHCNLLSQHVLSVVCHVLHLHTMSQQLEMTVGITMAARARQGEETISMKPAWRV